MRNPVASRAAVGASLILGVTLAPAIAAETGATTGHVPLAVQPTFTPDRTRIMFKLWHALSGAHDAISTIALDGTGMASGVGETWFGGWHPRLRPTS